MAREKSTCKQKCESLKKFLWNSETRECLGRTGSSWGKIGAFYLVFYSGLTAFFAVMLLIFFQTIDYNIPKQLEKSSLLKNNPGMGFRPAIDKESTLIKFSPNDTDHINKYVANINEMLQPYLKDSPSNAIQCNGTTMLGEGQVCEFPLDNFKTHCENATSFGYTNGTPCVLLKINQIFGWKPETFSSESLDDPENSHARAAVEAMGADIIKDDHIGLTCQGENEADQDHVGTINYFPRFGFPLYYFPYKNTPNYLQPLVFVKFMNPRRRTLIQVWCKLWAVNIRHHKNDRAGSVHFELFVE